MRKYNGMEYVTEENLHITFGAGQALLLTMETILEPGDEVIVPTPCFPNYFGYIHMAGGTSVIVPTCEENGFRVTAEEIKAKITTRTKAIILNSPCNPTGAVLTEADMRQIAAVAVEHNLIVISDEPYEAIIYDGQKEFQHRIYSGDERFGHHHKQLLEVLCHDWLANRLRGGTCGGEKADDPATGEHGLQRDSSLPDSSLRGDYRFAGVCGGDAQSV